MGEGASERRAGKQRAHGLELPRPGMVVVARRLARRAWASHAGCGQGGGGESRSLERVATEDGGRGRKNRNAPVSCIISGSGG